MQAPDLDRRLRYTPRWTIAEGECRLRIWFDERIVLVTELEDNPGASVTNAIEVIAEAVERVIDQPIDRFLLVEHYERTAMRGSTYDRVSFSGRLSDRTLVGPAWAPLTPATAKILREAVEGLDVDVSTN